MTATDPHGEAGGVPPEPQSAQPQSPQPPAAEYQPAPQAPAQPHPQAHPQQQWSDPAAVAAADPRRKSPVLACILSAMPGLGQVYVGYYRQGFIHATVVAAVISVLNIASNNSPLVPLFGMFLPFFWLYNIVDAGRRATFYNQALAGVDGVDIPPEMALPSPGGSVAGGVILIAFGAVLLSHTVFDYSLEWLEDWWPAIPVIFGIWLVVRGMKDRQE
jgi:hypothetical protein